MENNKLDTIIIPDVKASEFYELYNIHYGDKGGKLLLG